MSKYTKSAAAYHDKKEALEAYAYRDREEALEAYFKCIQPCRDYKDHTRHDACITKCQKGDWSFPLDSKLSDQLDPIMDKLNDSIADLSDIETSLYLMGL